MVDLCPTLPSPLYIKYIGKCTNKNDKIVRTQDSFLKIFSRMCELSFFELNFQIQEMYPTQPDFKLKETIPKFIFSDVKLMKIYIIKKQSQNIFQTNWPIGQKFKPAPRKCIGRDPS